MLCRPDIEAVIKSTLMCRDDTKTGSQRDQGLCRPDTEVVSESLLEMCRNDTELTSQCEQVLSHLDIEAVCKITCRLVLTRQKQQVRCIRVVSCRHRSSQ